MSWGLISLNSRSPDSLPERVSGESPCGLANCPIVAASTIDRRLLKVETLEPGPIRYRVAPTQFADAGFTPAGVGNGRFSPLDRREHTYVAEQRSAALLESALHEAAGPNPRIYRAQLARYELVTVQFRGALSLVDLRDDALAALGLERRQLTGSTARHYPCTRRVAERLAGTKGTAGLLWTSRQGLLHAERNPDGLASEVLRHESLDVAVVYRPDFAGGVDVVDRTPLVVNGEPSRFALELANLLRIAVL